MKLREIGEFGFINRFKPLFNNLIKEGQTGIGDDCAILNANEKEDWLITTDLLIEDVHFLRDQISPYQLGFKSLAVNLSDIAAMGGIPLASFLSIAIPPGIDVEYLDDLMNGYGQLSTQSNTALLGGDTTKSLKNMAINVCVIGKCEKGKARLRSMAKPGDIICVTGFLGDSAAGLDLILNNMEPAPVHSFLIDKHYYPEPRLTEGQFLSAFQGVHAMMDISDGIASDLQHVLNASGYAADIYLDKLPLSEQLIEFCEMKGKDAFQLATCGGEDYELLFTVSDETVDILEKQYSARFSVPFTRIGVVNPGKPKIHWYKGYEEIKMNTKGYNHFQ